MIEFKVKTLDGSEHEFRLNNQVTLEQFRPMLADKTSIPAARQRLIFQGKVLQANEQLLSDIGVNGKVLHVVERAPNAAPQGGAARNANRAEARRRFEQAAMGIPQYVSRHLTQPQIEALIGRALSRLVGVQHQMTSRRRGNILNVRIQFRPARQLQVNSPARARMLHIRQILRHARHMLYHLEREPLTGLECGDALSETVTEGPVHLSNQAPPSHTDDQMDLGFSPLVGDCRDRSHELPPNGQGNARSDSPTPVTVDTDNESAEGDTAQELMPPNNTDGRTVRLANALLGYSVHHAMAFQLAELFDEVMAVQVRLQPQMQRFRALVARDPDFTGNLEQGRTAARFVSSVQVAMHNVSHILHTLSDLSMHFCEAPPRRLYPQYTRIDGNLTQGEAEVTLTIGSDAMGIPNNNAQGAEAPAANNNATPSNPPFMPNVQQFMPRTAAANGGVPLPPRIGVRVGAPRAMAGIRMPMPPGMMPAGVRTQAVRVEVNQNGQMRVSDAQGNPIQPDGALMQNVQRMMGPMQQNFIQRIQQQHQQFTGQNIPGAAPPPPRPAAPPTNQGAPPTPTNQGAPPTNQGAPPTNQGAAPTNEQPARANAPPAHAQGARHAHGHARGGAGPGRPASGHPLGAIHLNEENMEEALEQAVFVGPRPPSELPLFTLDPFMPCSSRHFDPRHLRRLRETRARGVNAASTSEGQGQTEASASASSASAGTDTDTTTASQTHSADAAATARYANDEPANMIDDEEEFVDMLERMLRSVAINLNGSSAPAPPAANRTHEQQQAEDDNDEQLYAFHPLGGLPSQMMPQAHAHTLGGQATGEDTAVTGTVTVDTQQLAAVNGALTGDNRRMIGQVLGNLQSGSDQTLAQFVRNFTNDENADLGESPGFVGYLMRCVGDCMSVPDMYSLVIGNWAPFDARRQPIRQHVITRVLNDNSRPSAEDLQSASERICATVNQLREVLGLVGDELPLTTQDDQGNTLHVLGCLAACERVHSARVLAAVLDRPEHRDADDTRSFGQRVYERTWQFLREYAFLIDLASTPQRDLIRRFLVGAQLFYARSSADQTTPSAFALNESMMDLSLQQLRTSLQRNNNVNWDTVRPYLVFMTADITQQELVAARELAAVSNSTSTSTADTQTTAVPVQNSASNTSTATSVSVSSTDSTSTSYSTASDGSNSHTLSGGTDQDQHMTDADSEHVDVVMQSPKPGDKQWNTLLPKDWTSVIEQDIERQKHEPKQAAFSDSYLAGVPYKRRKVLLAARQCMGTTCADHLHNTLTRAIQQTNVQPITGDSNEQVCEQATHSQALLNAHTDHVDATMQRRVRADPDFDAAKFPNADKIFEKQ